MTTVLMALLGAILGSFLNLCIDRLPRGQSLLHPQSRCEACGIRLPWPHLVPIVSFLALRGRCNYCKARIPRRVLVVELLTTAVMAYLGDEFGLSPESLALSVYGLVFILISFVDLEHGIIPNRVVYPAAGAAVGLSIFLPEVGPARALIGGALGFGALLAVYLAARGGMGGGDVKLAGLIGLAAGFPLVVPALLLAALAGGAIAVVLLTIRHKSRYETVPFGPFLAAGGVVSLLWGSRLLDGWAEVL